MTKGENHFDILPEGWIEVTHNSGMPLYLHKATRVCSMSRPYFLGPGSVRVFAGVAPFSVPFVTRPVSETRDTLKRHPLSELQTRVGRGTRKVQK